MKQLMRIVKWSLCVFGGGSAAAFIMCLLAVLVFGLHDPEATVSFLTIWARVAGVLGAATGALIVFRSERRVTS